MTLRVLECSCRAYGWSSEEYHLQHPEISMVQICAALAYYYEHQAALDQQIRVDLAWASTEYQKAFMRPLRDRVRRIRQKSA